MKCGGFSIAPTRSHGICPSFTVRSILLCFRQKPQDHWGHMEGTRDGSSIKYFIHYVVPTVYSQFNVQLSAIHRLAKYAKLDDIV